MNLDGDSIKELTKLLNSPIITTIIGFFLGAFGSFLLTLRKYIKNKYNLCKFNTMIEQTYVKPYHDLLNKYFIVNDPTNVGLLQNHISKSVKKLEYLRKNEIDFLNTDNQFKMIRSIEFTKLYFKHTSDFINYYTSKDVNSTQEEYDKDIKYHKEKLEEAKKIYKNNRTDYINLKIDEFK